MPRLLLVTTVAVTLRSFLLPFAEHYRARGWRVEAMANGVSACEVCQQAFDSVWEVPWSRNPLSALLDGAACRRVREVCAKGRYDIVHVHTPVAAFVTRAALRDALLRPKVVYTAHGFHFYRGGPVLRNAVFQLAERLAGRWTDYLVVINHEDLAAARRLRLVPPERVVYMPGIGIDRETYSRKRVTPEDVLRVRTEMGLGTADPLVVVVGELSRRKRPQDALAALALMRHRSSHLAFVGDGPLRERLQQRAMALGVGSRVHWLGQRGDVPALLRAAQAGLLASEREGLARSVMEALSLEVPFVGADSRGIRDLLADGCGLLVKVGDIAGMACALDWVLDHPEQARDMARRGRDRLVEHDIARILHLHDLLYGKALETR
ncbi:MAG: glycosyltransferase [Anaerolineae bacterium]